MNLLISLQIDASSLLSARFGSNKPTGGDQCVIMTSNRDSRIVGGPYPKGMNKNICSDHSV